MNPKLLWTFAITSTALFMTTLDNLVVTTALPVIRRDLHAGLSGLEWTVNAYTLTFAVLLLTGAALGDRLGRRRVFAIGLGVFTAASAAAALAPSIVALDVARAVQGVGGAIVMPLTLTILSSAVPAEKRGLVRGNEVGWGSAQIVGSLVAGTAVVAAFVAWELRTAAPMLPMRFFRNRTFSLANLASLFMSFGMFGAIFLLAQFFQTVQGYSPLASGVRILPWTVMPMFVAPVAGALSDRIGGHKIIGVGLALQALGLAWIAAVSTPATPYWELVGPFTISGIGMALFFAPVANVVLSAVRPEEQGQASGANNAVRELGGVFGVAVLAAVFSADGGYGGREHLVARLEPAGWVGAGGGARGALAAFAIGRRPRRAEEQH